MKLLMVEQDGDIDLSQRANHAAELWKIVKSMLEKAEEAEKELGSPNKVTTGIACKVLEQLGEHFPELRGKSTGWSLMCVDEDDDDA